MLAPLLSRCRLLGALAALIVLACAAPSLAATGASRLEVRDGVLTLIKAPGEATRVALEYGGGSRWGALDYGGGAFEDFSAASEKWPGVLPSPGAGCASRSDGGDESLCEGVTSVDLTGSDDSELIEVSSFGTAVRLIGNGGRDGLLSLGAGSTEIDGGEGNDALALDRGVARGGPGNDQIDIRALTSRHDERPTFGPVTVDCGPGSDTLLYGTINRQRLPSATVDRASCPPIITPLRRIRPQFPGDYPQVRLPASHRLRIAALRTPEALHGTLRAPKGAAACVRPKRFKMHAGGTLRLTLRFTAEGVRRSRSNSRNRSFCRLDLVAKDAGGDRVEEYMPFLIRPR